MKPTPAQALAKKKQRQRKNIQQTKGLVMPKLTEDQMEACLAMKIREFCNDSTLGWKLDEERGLSVSINAIESVLSEYRMRLSEVEAEMADGD